MNYNNKPDHTNKGSISPFGKRSSILKDTGSSTLRKSQDISVPDIRNSRNILSRGVSSFGHNSRVVPNLRTRNNQYVTNTYEDDAKPFKGRIYISIEYS
jgi:hypothetical protein